MHKTNVFPGRMTIALAALLASTLLGAQTAPKMFKDTPPPTKPGTPVKAGINGLAPAQVGDAWTAPQSGGDSVSPAKLAEANTLMLQRISLLEKKLQLLEQRMNDIEKGKK